jgi:hypothetical protein
MEAFDGNKKTHVSENPADEWRKNPKQFLNQRIRFYRHQET